MGLKVMTRVIVSIDDNSDVRTEEEIKAKNDQVKILLSQGRAKMTDETKEAIRSGDFEKLMEQKRAQKSQETTTSTSEKRVSLKFGVVGSGQAGGKLAKVFHDFGYNVCAINTAKQDLELLEIPQENKYLITYTSSGSGKDLDIGRAAIESEFENVSGFVQKNMAGADTFILTVSGGGGSGAGSAPILVDLLSSFGKPVIVIFVLPSSADDTQSKHNAITTLAELSDMASKQKINSLVLVDNAKIEMAYPSTSLAQFWKLANNAIVEPLHMFNSLTARPTNYESLDGFDFIHSLLEAGGCTLFGSNKVGPAQYEENELALVSAIVDNLDHGLLVGGFELKEAISVGVLVTANQSVLERIPHSQISFIFKYISEEFRSAKVFKGIYAVPSGDDDISVHFVFSGLGLPRERIDGLKNDAKKNMEVLMAKKGAVADKMVIDLGKDKTPGSSDNIIGKIKKRNGVVGQMIRGDNKILTNRRR